MAEFLMPTLGADMTEGTLVEWKKRIGDRVSKGDILAEVETDKAAIEVESFTSGVLDQLFVKPGDTVPVGTIMAIIREDGTPTQKIDGKVEVQAEVNAKAELAAPRPAPPASTPTTGGRLRMSPAARQLAQELGVDPASLVGTGPAGAITRDDVQCAAERLRPTTSTAPPAEAATDRQTRMRQTIAAAMSRSKREIPHYYLNTTIDMGPALDWLTKENAARSVTDRLLPGVLLIKAVALALQEFPEFNGFWKDGQAVQSPSIHVGVAISLRGGGLVAPALRNTDRLSLSEVMQQLQDLVKRARAFSLRSSEMSDPTMTVTSLGDLGVDTVLGVIYPPQVALVGFGKIVERPWVVNGGVLPRPVVSVSLSADHRVSDGQRGAMFLGTIDRLLQNPASL